MTNKQMQMAKLLISEMNMDELRNINSYLAICFKQQQSRAAKTFSKGDKVSFDHPKLGKVIGTVEKVNQKTVSVITAKNGNWKVAGSLLKAA